MWLGDGGEHSRLATEVDGRGVGTCRCRDECPRTASQDSGDHNSGNIDREEAHCTHELESGNNSHQLPGDPDFGGGSRAVIRISFQYESIKSYRD